MYKPDSLRKALTAASPALRQNPDRLRVFIDEGAINCAGGASLSFEYAYTLDVLVTDYAGHPDTLIVPILAWLRRHQPDLLLNPDRMRDGFTFEADLLNNQTADISIKIKLTERVRVSTSPDGKTRKAEHLPEPVTEPLDFVEHWTLYVLGEKVAEWDHRPEDVL